MGSKWNDKHWWTCKDKAAEIGEDFRVKDIDSEDFDNFKFSADYTKYQHQVGDITKTPPTNLSNITSKSGTCTPAESFKKGIKRDSTIYNIFKDGKNWDNWRRHLKATAMAQDVFEVLDVNFAPASNEDTELFTEKQKFMCSVFERTLQTDQGKAFFRQYETTCDAQII